MNRSRFAEPPTSSATRRYTLDHSWSRTVAALFGTLPVALSFGVLLVRGLPFGLGARYVIGWASIFPVWACLACWVFLARSGKRAWLLLCLLLALFVSARLGARAMNPIPHAASGR